MSGGRRRTGESRRLAAGALAATAGAFLAFGMAPLAVAPPAQADPFDVVVDQIVDSIESLSSTVGADQLFDPDAVLAALTSAADGASVPPLAAATANFDEMLANAVQQYIYLPIHTAGEEWINSPLGQTLDQIINAPEGGGGGWLLGDGGAGFEGTAPGAVAAVGAPAGLIGNGGDAAGADAPTTESDPLPANAVPLRMEATTEPVIDISVSGGPSIPVVIDTGSNGLVMPWWDIGLNNLSFPTGWGIGAYSGGLNYFYLTFPETVDFGNGIVTAPTDIEAFIFGFPTSLADLFSFPLTLEQFLGPANASGVLGIGPDALGPDTSGVAAVISDLPGNLNQGVLIDEPGHQLVFGPSPLTGGTTVGGVAQSTLYVSVDGGSHQPIHSIIDSGGVYGTISSSLAGGQVGQAVPSGTDIAVYNQNGDLLYSYTTSGAASPTIISGNSMNTGYYPFIQQPVYIGYQGGPTTTFYGSP